MGGQTSRHPPPELTNREAATAWGNDRPNLHDRQRSDLYKWSVGEVNALHIQSGSYAHGFHLAKVENVGRHGTRFDGCRHFDSSRPSALVHQPRSGCGMAMQPHSVRSYLFSFHEMIGRTAHRDARPKVAAAGEGGHAL